jgi:2-polyprenyl-6-methoxyphenol hydroxylase-like FAD-dependent oxidoreductase
MNGIDEMPLYDVAIIGGGLVGASLACALSPLGMKVALVEAYAGAQREFLQDSGEPGNLVLPVRKCHSNSGDSNKGA